MLYIALLLLQEVCALPSCLLYCRFISFSTLGLARWNQWISIWCSIVTWFIDISNLNMHACKGSILRAEQDVMMWVGEILECLAGPVQVDDLATLISFSAGNRLLLPLWGLFIWVWVATAFREGIIKTVHTHSLTHIRTNTHSWSRVELSLPTALSIFPLIRAPGQRTSLKGHRCTANCLIKKFGGAWGAAGGAQKGPKVDGARSPRGSSLRRSTLIGNSDPSRWPCLFTPHQTGERRSTPLSLSVSLYIYLSLSICLCPLCCDLAGWKENETEWIT